MKKQSFLFLLSILIFFISSFFYLINCYAKPWVLSAPPSIYQGEKLYDYIDGGADLFFEYRFISCIVQRYTKGKSQIETALFKFKDPYASFGIFSIKKGGKCDKIPIGEIGCIRENELIFFKGCFFFQAILIEGNKDDMKFLYEIASKEAKKIYTKKWKRPIVFKYIDQKKGVNNSVRYFLGPLGFRNSLPEVAYLFPKEGFIEGAAIYSNNKIKIALRFSNKDELKIYLSKFMDCIKPFIMGKKMGYLSLRLKKGKFILRKKKENNILLIFFNKIKS